MKINRIIVIMVIIVTFIGAEFLETIFTKTNRVLIKSSSPIMVTFCRERGHTDELVFKTSDGSPLLLQVTEENFKVTSIPILKGEIYSHDYTVSVNGQIAYIVNDHIFVCWPKEKKKIEIESNTISQAPTWAPNGKRLVYCLKGKLICYDLDTGIKTNLSQGKLIQDPVWPLSDRIYFIKDNQVVELNLETKNEKLITNMKAIYKDLTFDFNTNLLYFSCEVWKQQEYDGIQQYDIVNEKLSTVIDGYYRLYGICQKGQGLCLVDEHKGNQLLVYDLKNREKAIIEEKNASGGITTNSGNAVLYATFDNLYLYWF